ncbi:MAG: PA14 domain-containing protein [Bacteroidota bacterium]
MNRFLYLLIFSIFLLFGDTLVAQPACLGEQGQLKWLLYENIRDNELDHLTHLQLFPNNPTAHENITGLKSPGNEWARTVDGATVYSVEYGSYYGSVIRGYLKVPQSGNYTFNITGDDQVRFLLSTDETRVNLVAHAFVNRWTYRKEFAKPDEGTNQTSNPIALNSNNYYYFEVWQKEHSGGDHVEVTWKTPTNSIDWQDIPSTSLYDYACAFDCPPSGTPCDDGDATTTDDIQDGFCNCVGIPTNKSSCVGERGAITALYYLGIPGNKIEDLYNADKYPLAPDTAEVLDLLKGPLVNRDTFGTRISGLIKVPVSGNYQFAVTGDDRVSFKLSTDENPANATEISYTNWSSNFDKYRHETQVQAPVTLNKNDFYYFEMNHREGSGNDRFNVFWRTPFTQDTLWRYIDKNYLYGYACEMACVPEGTPCDDGNNFTKDDQFDDQCNCVGTPCRTGDCEDTADAAPNFTKNEACGVGNKTDNSATDAWESCTPQANPNAGRGVSHWIQYDLGKEYLLNGTHIWNYNGAGNTGKGFKDVVIDYSSDGTTWTQLGDIFTWEQANGMIGYEGFEGPNFSGVTARYILVTALNNWDNGTCSGFSKITFNATTCLQMGQPCDDGDPDSVNDHYDVNCNCIGEGVGYGNAICGPTELIQTSEVLASDDYRATISIRSKAIVPTGNIVQLLAGESITLEAGFTAEPGSELTAALKICENPPAYQGATDLSSFSKVTDLENALSEDPTLTPALTPSFEDVSAPDLQVWPNPTSSWTSFHFNLPVTTTASLCIYSTDGKQISCLAEGIKFPQGTYTKEFPAQRLAAGMYYVVLKTESAVLTRPLAVIE